jgi:TolA-binding protein
VKSLVVQLNDQVAKSNMLLEQIAKSLEQQALDSESREDPIAPEIRTLSGKIDEMITSISAWARQGSELKVQSKPIRQILPSDLSASDDTFNQALNDLIGGDSDLAIEGFNAYLTFFPDGDKADAARYYIGEAHYNMKRYPEAIEAFTQIIDANTDSGKVVSALFKRGKSNLAMRETDAAISDFKEAMQRYPDSPEASLSKAELQSLGVLRAE